MKYLNAVAAMVLVLGLGVVMQQRTPPPDDPWFLQVVARSPRPVLVKFGADWCPPCRHVEKVLDRAEGHLRGRIKIVRIDIDERPELARHYGISGIPRLMLFQDGKIIASHGGFGDAESLQKWVDQSVR